MRIQRVTGREILDSRGNPTVEADVLLEGGHRGRAAVPSGASTGALEALELRDKDPTRYLGRGVRQAVGHLEGPIHAALAGRDAGDQAGVDRLLLELDGTPNKARLGANAILAASLAVAHAAAAARGLPLYRYLAEEVWPQGGRPAIPDAGRRLPVPLLNVINGGVHADSGLAVQEFMLVPAGFDRFADALRAGAEVYQHLKKLLADAGAGTALGDEGGFAPRLDGDEAALEFLMQAIERARYRPGRDIFLALDCAATEWWAGGGYTLYGRTVDAAELVATYRRWAGAYPLISIEDGLAEDDWEGWRALTAALGDRLQLVGDDLFVTNPARVRQGIDARAANAILVKPNQIGTLSETLDTMALGVGHGYAAVISHRSGETEDTTIADLAVATAAGQIKTGAPARSERVAKYNRLLRIEEALGPAARFGRPGGSGRR